MNQAVNPDSSTSSIPLPNESSEAVGLVLVNVCEAKPARNLGEIFLIFTNCLVSPLDVVLSG